MVGGIWGQTRSYGDTYHWAFHDGTVESVSAVPVFFLRRREPGAGDEVAADISQPGGAEVSDEGAQARRLWASGNFGSGYAGLGNVRARSLQPESGCYSAVMALPIDDADFIDREVHGAREPAGNPQPAAAPRPPTREELAAKVSEAQHRIAELKRAQEELERERSALEEARRRRAEFESGRAEVIEQLTRGIGLLEKAEFEARKSAEGMARTLAAFREALTQVEAIKEETWTLENWNTELTRALTTVENARMEMNSARLKWPLLDGVDAAAMEQKAENNVAGAPTDLLKGRTFGELCKLGFALTWPLALVMLLAFGALIFGQLAR